jgi:hypothetical protein
MYTKLLSLKSSLKEFFQGIMHHIPLLKERVILWDEDIEKVIKTKKKGKD